MNTETITLSSNSTNLKTITSEYNLDDVTELNISFSNIDESSMPLYMIIDWGDGVIETFDNNIIQTNLNNINNFNYNPLFTNTYNHEYYPSNYALYKSLSAQILIKYSNSDETWFILPFKIRTYDYFESIYDLEFMNFNILPGENYPKQYQFITQKDRYLVELRSS
jgi:hypothetical protein